MDIHTVFLKEYAVQVHSKACFEASFAPFFALPVPKHH